MQRWRAKQQQGVQAHREALASASRRTEEAARARQAVEATAARARVGSLVSGVHVGVLKASTGPKFTRLHNPLNNPKPQTLIPNES